MKTFLQDLKPFQGSAFVVIAQVLVIEYVLVCLLSLPFGDLIRQNGVPFGADFLNVYAAGILANRGMPEAVYDFVLHRQVEEQVVGHASAYFAWHYPPMFLFIASLCARVPYALALGLYLAIGFAGYWAALRCIAPKTKEAFWMLAAFPGVFVNIINGQNGFITTALLGAGMHFLESRPWLAGTLLGLLSYKPQFFVVIPLVLAVAGYRRALLAALLSAAASAALSLGVFGKEAWIAFFNSLSLTQRIVVEEGWTGWQKIQSVNAAVRMLGGSLTTAYMIQGTSAILALFCALWIWRGKTAFDVRVAALCAAILLTTPYATDYDLTLLIVPVAFWARLAAQTGFRNGEKIMISAVWFLPMVARIVGGHGLPLTPFVLAALLMSCLVRARVPLRAA